ncbi:hypothetical protein IJ117_02540 [Candidatus Saccharibacteria bacterium]|nr:hypothetical protein [Candidatus Saccharibacteria bacterium]
MRRIQKNILGLSGLALVAGMTACAAIMPVPGASATTTSLTDTLVVKVVKDEPEVHLTTTAADTVTDPNYPYAVDYNYASKVIIDLTYVDESGVTRTATIETFDNLDYDYGEQSVSVDVRNVTFDDDTMGGYGNYTITATAIDIHGTEHEYSIKFEYVPVIGEAIAGSGANRMGKVTSMGDDVETVRVFTKDGVEVGKATREELENNGMILNMDLSKVGCQEILYLRAYGADDTTFLYERPYPLYMGECPVVPDTGAPDTGGLFQNLNISKEDYLITGLIVFFVLGIVGFGVVARNKKTTSSRKRR